MRLCTFMWLLAAMEWYQFAKLVKQYGTFGEDPIEVMSRMPLAELMRARGRAMCALVMTMLAQMAWWLP